MASNYMERTTDGRRAKMRRMNQSQLPLLEALQVQIEQRPEAQYDVGDIVTTPIGYRRVVLRYHSASGWKYQVTVRIEYIDRPRPYSRTFDEHEVRPISAFYVGQEIALPCGVRKPIHTVGLSPNHRLLIGVEIRPKQFSWFTEDTIYRHNPALITPEYALKQLYVAYVNDIGSKEKARSMCLTLYPELENIQL